MFSHLVFRPSLSALYSLNPRCSSGYVCGSTRQVRTDSSGRVRPGNPDQKLSAMKYQVVFDRILNVIKITTSFLPKYLECQANLEMSYRKIVIILRFPGEYYGIRGHNHVKPKKTYKIAHKYLEQILWYVNFQLFRNLHSGLPHGL